MFFVLPWFTWVLCMFNSFKEKKDWFQRWSWGWHTMCKENIMWAGYYADCVWANGTVTHCIVWPDSGFGKQIFEATCVQSLHFPSWDFDSTCQMPLWGFGIFFSWVNPTWRQKIQQVRIFAMAGWPYSPSNMLGAKYEEINDYIQELCYAESLMDRIWCSLCWLILQLVFRYSNTCCHSFFVGIVLVETDLPSKRKNLSFIYNWLVVWIIFLFSNILGIIIPID